MPVEIVIPAFLQPFTDGAGLAGTGANTLGGCLDELVGRFPRLREKLYVSDNVLHNGINVFINGQRADPKDLARPVEDGDKIHLAYVTVGG